MVNKISGISGVPAGRGKIALALGILAVLALTLTVFAVADHPETDGADVERGTVTVNVTGGGGRSIFP